ncbi:MAG: DUF1992 domain-containing protein [Deltaproteobacteria bacterium]|jgi:hypothetical protein|nr:MAG: DUF1992 domain-containing protein [Deltaproteobacteria bacterium]HBX43521.1 DUF1992 domain-containing protein [Deltaproteobacteria bacterium]
MPARGTEGETVLFLEVLAERKIREAMERGEFANLPGAGKPLRLEDDSMIPEDLRVAYKILRNAGCIPPELEVRKEIITLRDLLRTIEDEEARRDTIRELNYRLLKLGVMGKRMVNLDEFPEYRERILGRMAGRKAG